MIDLATTTTMPNIELSASDDPVFGHAVQAAVLGVIHESHPLEVYLVKVDNWFGPRWLAFSHKALGAVRVTSSNLRVPPFVPGRVVHQNYFVRTDEHGGYVVADNPFALHILQTSSANSARRLSALCPKAALFWWSGSTQATGRGAMMAYIPSPSGHDYWYAELTKKTRWRSGTMKGITSSELASYRAAGEAAQQADGADRPHPAP